MQHLYGGVRSRVCQRPGPDDTQDSLFVAHPDNDGKVRILAFTFVFRCPCLVIAIDCLYVN